jgi:hypothetical protein
MFISLFSFILCGVFITFLDAQHTTLILGKAKENVYKSVLWQKLQPELHGSSVHDENAVFVIFHSESLATNAYDPNYVKYVKDSNLTATTVFAQKGTSEMSLEELSVLQQIVFDTNSGIVAIEIGEEVPQTLAVLEKSSYCWGISEMNIEAPNRVIFCNDIKPSVLPFGLRKDIRAPQNDAPV